MNLVCSHINLFSDIQMAVLYSTFSPRYDTHNWVTREHPVYGVKTYLTVTFCPVCVHWETISTHLKENYELLTILAQILKYLNSVSFN